MSFEIKRIGHVAVTVPDVAVTVSFYNKVLGLEISARAGEAVFLRCNHEHHCLGIYPGPTRSLHHLGLEVADLAALDTAQSYLAAHGLLPEARSFVEPGHGAALCYRDNDGQRFELYVAMETVDQPLAPSEARPVKFGHLTFLATDLRRSLEFYTGMLGFRISDAMGDAIAWLRCNKDHHGVAFLNAGESRVHHYAYELADWNAIKHLCDHLSRLGVPIIYGPSRHGPGHNLFTYISDPDGNIIELFSELDQIGDEASYQPLQWKDEPRTLDAWRAIAPPAYFMRGEGHDVTDWSAGSPVIGSGWRVVRAGDFVALDPAARITTPTAAVPEFTISIPRFTLGCANPLDHAKAMVYTDQSFPTGVMFSVAAEMAVDVQGTEANPFGADPDDPRLGSGALAVLDDSTGIVLNFEVSNRRVLALRERFVVAAPGGAGSDVPLAEPVLTDVRIEPGSWHHYELRYHPGDDRMVTPGPDHAEWWVDGQLVHRVEWVATVVPPAAPVIKPIRFRVGMAIFTLMDNLPDGKGGVIAGIDPEYRATIFGQGVIARWRRVQIKTG